LLQPDNPLPLFLDPWIAMLHITHLITGISHHQAALFLGG